MRPRRSPRRSKSSRSNTRQEASAFCLFRGSSPGQIMHNFVPAAEPGQGETACELSAQLTDSCLHPSDSPVIRIRRPYHCAAAGLARFSHGTIERERDDATLPKMWTPRDGCDRTLQQVEAVMNQLAAVKTFSHVKPGDTEYKGGGLRDFFLYRDLGIAAATRPGDLPSGQGQSGLSARGRHRLASP